MPPTNEDLFRCVAEWVRANYPGRLPRRLRIQLDGEDEVTLPIPLSQPALVEGGETLDDAILGVLEEESPLIGKKIASRLGCPYNSRFRARLAEMARSGELNHGPDGYRVTPAT